MFACVENPKQVVILTAAFDVFASYGFKRTSMDDIAKAAGVSRPALYQSFANKSDIYRAIVGSFFDTIETQWKPLVQSDGPVVERLVSVFEIGVVQPHTMIENMPHGDELIGLKNDVAEDLYRNFNSRLHSVFVQILKSDSSASDELAEHLADMLSQSLAGMKAESCRAVELKSGFDNLLHIVAAAMRGSA